MSHIPHKEFEPGDPLELQGVQCDGDADEMIACVIEEYLRLGWPAARLFHLFASPFYPPLHRFLLIHGPEEVRRRIEAAAARCGVFRFHIREAPPDPELVTIAPASTTGGCPHGSSL